MVYWVHTCVQELRGQVGGQKEARTGYGGEPLSPHPCTSALGLWEQLQFLREELEQVAKKGRARRAQSAKLNSDLCKAHRWVLLPVVISAAFLALQLPSCKVGWGFKPFDISLSAWFVSVSPF